jgi:hypothetical protein
MIMKKIFFGASCKSWHMMIKLRQYSFLAEFTPPFREHQKKGETDGKRKQRC